MSHRKPKPIASPLSRLYVSGEVLGMFNPTLNRRDAIHAASYEMAGARLALAMRTEPASAVAMAILHAQHRRHRFS